MLPIPKHGRNSTMRLDASRSPSEVVSATLTYVRNLVEMPWSARDAALLLRYHKASKGRSRVTEEPAIMGAEGRTMTLLRGPESVGVNSTSRTEQRRSMARTITPLGRFPYHWIADMAQRAA